MIEELLEQEYQLERTRIIGETAQIPWLELQRFFAAGKVIWIATELDLAVAALGYVWLVRRRSGARLGRR